MKAFLGAAALSWIAVAPAGAQLLPADFGPGVTLQQALEWIKTQPGAHTYRVSHPQSGNFEVGWQADNAASGKRAIVATFVDAEDNPTSGAYFCIVNKYRDANECLSFDDHQRFCNQKKFDDAEFVRVACRAVSLPTPNWQPTAPPPVQVPTPAYWVRQDLNIRAMPDPGSLVVGGIPNGSFIDVKTSGCQSYTGGRNGGLNVWCQASFGDQVGWVNTYFVARQGLPILACKINRIAEGC